MTSFFFDLFLIINHQVMKKTATLLALLLITFCKAQFNAFLEVDSTNFESNASLVHLDFGAKKNIWQIGWPHKEFFGNAYSQPFAIMTDERLSYPIDNLSSFTVSIQPALAAFIPDVFIGFWHKFQTDSLKDGGYLEISLDSGAIWKNVILANSLEGVSIYGSTNFYSSSDTIQGGIPAFTGEQSQWKYSELFLQWILPVPPSPNHKYEKRDLVTQKVMLRFNFKSDLIQTNKAGWIIDNLTIGIKDLVGSAPENTLSNFDVRFFPNPVNEQGLFQVFSKNDDRDFTLKIYNPSGQVVISTVMDKNNQFIIKTKGLIAGMYFYEVTNKKGNSQSGKIIIK